MKDTISRQTAINALMPIYKTASTRNRNVFSVARKCLETIENLPSAESKIIRCKDCKHYHEDVWGDEIGHEDIPLILAHQMCDFWGGGCKTKEDAFCSFAEIAEE